MSISLADLAPLKRNPDAAILVGRLPQVISEHFGWAARSVYLNGERLEHILSKPGVTEYDVLLIPFALQHGLLLQEPERPHTLITCYQHPENEARRFKGALKVLDPAGFEIWVSTFHPTKPGQTRALLARSTKLRDHL